MADPTIITDPDIAKIDAALDKLDNMPSSSPVAAPAEPAAPALGSQAWVDSLRPVTQVSPPSPVQQYFPGRQGTTAPVQTTYVSADEKIRRQRIEDAAAEGKPYAFTKANGRLEFDFGLRGFFRKITIYGGPFDDFEPGPGSFGVCLRAEKNDVRATRYVPVQDYSTPSDDHEIELAVADMVLAALNGDRVYIGCMAGRGRTGLILAVMAKVFVADDPVAFVRKHYLSHAVETPPQKAYVDKFDVTRLRRWVYSIARAHTLRMYLPWLKPEPELEIN